MSEVEGVATATAGPLDRCPFLRAIGGPPAPGPDQANGCSAHGEWLAQGLRQQALVCLAPAHRDCARFRHGAVATIAAPAARGWPRATVAASLVLLASIGLTVGLTIQHGGLELAAAPSPAASDAAAAHSSPAPTAAAPSVASVAPSAPVPSAAPTADATASLSPLLVACPDRPACYLYRVQGGDSLASIADRFGVAYGAVLKMNPALADPDVIHVGQQIALPPPTR
ncbi:MAG TPA: LysM domain-containing protein [Candidatus Limnocylindrales bacterium]